ncbi:MAG TPA: glycosyltransferase [Vicinamibacterales bacterium]
MTRVSVVIPAFNAGRTIAAAIQSVFAQTCGDYELIVVDDGSTDDTLSQVRMSGDHITCLCRANGGAGAARNEALRIATGHLVAFLDADDVWLPWKLERQVAYFERFPETGLLHGGALVSRTPLQTALGTRDVEDPGAGIAAPSGIFCELFHGDLDINTLTVMAPRHVLLETGGFDERRELHVEDWDLWLRIAARHPVGYLPMPLAIHRPGGAMSSAVEKTFLGQRLVIQQSAHLCQAGCRLHAEAPQQCLERREHRYYSELGYQQFWTGEMKQARSAFAEALRRRPDSIRTRVYHAATFVGRRWFDLARRVLRAGRAGGEPAAIATPDLIQDTPVRRARAAVARGVHRIDDAIYAIGRTRQRILFEGASPLSLVVASPVIEAMRGDRRLELWFTANDSVWNASDLFDGAGINQRVVSAAAARWMKFDAHLNTDFWNMTWLPRGARRVHFFHGVAGKYDLDAPTRIAPVVATFDRLLFPNRDRLRRYAEAGLVDPDTPTAALIGYPKVDCLVDGTLNRYAIGAELGLDRSRRTVLYAPTWSAHSSLNKAGESIITALRQGGHNVIVKLHDRSYDPSMRASGGINWRTEIERICREQGAHLARGYDAAPYLYVADALVTDHSSVGFEFMLLDRPVIVFDCPELIDAARVNPQKVTLLRSGADVAALSDLGRVVDRALDTPASLSARRREIAADLFYGPGFATGRAVQCIYELLGLPAPVSPLEPVLIPTPVDRVPVLSRSSARTSFHV